MDGVSVLVVVAGGWLASDALTFVTGGVVESAEVVAGAVVSVGAGVVVEVEVVSAGVDVVEVLSGAEFDVVSAAGGVVVSVGAGSDVVEAPKTVPDVSAAAGVSETGAAGASSGTASSAASSAGSITDSLGVPRTDRALYSSANDIGYSACCRRGTCGIKGGRIFHVT
jgi:hypothetical protein